MLRFTNAPPSDEGASVNRSIIKGPCIRIPKGIRVKLTAILRLTAVSFDMKGLR